MLNDFSRNNSVKSIIAKRGGIIVNTRVNEASFWIGQCSQANTFNICVATHNIEPRLCKCSGDITFAAAKIKHASNTETTTCFNDDRLNV